jgi:septum formation protein
MEDDVRTPHLVLASASPRRLLLLQQIGINAMVYPVGIDEIPRSYESSLDLVKRLALEKARAGHNDMIQKGIKLPVLGSDTIVEINGSVLGKPSDERDAKNMLAMLSGRVHSVHTAVTVVTSFGEYSELSSSRVEFAPLSKGLIQSYIETGEPLDKAGAYAIQGMAGQFVKSLEGSYSGVMGLPLYETTRVLEACGINPLFEKKE